MDARQMYRDMIRLAGEAELCRWHALLEGVQMAYEYGQEGQQCEVSQGSPGCPYDAPPDQWAEMMAARILAVLRSGQLSWAVFEEMQEIVAAELKRRDIQVEVREVVDNESGTVH